MSERVTRFANGDRGRPTTQPNESWVQTGAPEFATAENLYGAPAPSAIEKHELSPGERRVKELFRQSFRFSQGDPDLHNKITRWLVVGGHYDGLPVPEIAPAYIDALQPPKKHAEMDDDVVQVDVRFAWGHLNWLTKAKKHPPQDELAAEILEGMTDRDLNYANDGRPGRTYKSENAVSTAQDPFASYVRSYVLQKEPTGTDAFDQLNAQMQGIATEDLASDQDHEAPSPRQAKLRELQQKWEQQHDGEQFVTPQQAAEVHDESQSTKDSGSKNNFVDTSPYASELREGGEEAWEKFYTEYRDIYYSRAFRMLGDADAAEDAVQSAFLGLYKSIVTNGSDIAGKRIGGYMHRSVINAAISITRRNKSAHGRPINQNQDINTDTIRKRPPDGGSEVLLSDLLKPTIEEEVVGTDYVGKVVKSIENEDMRAVLQLKMEGLNEPEIAKKLGIPRNTVASRLRRARGYALAGMKKIDRNEDTSEQEKTDLQRKGITSEPGISASTERSIADQESAEFVQPQTVFQNKGKSK